MKDFLVRLKNKITLKRVLASLLGMVVLSVAFLAYFWMAFKAWLIAPMNISSEGLHYELDTGKSLSHLSQDLAVKGVLTHPRWLNWYARYYQKEKIHPGEYQLTQGLSPIELLEKLNKGDVVLHQLTFLEGWTFKQVLTVLNEKADLKHLLSGKSNAEILDILNLPISNPEGWFFPDTYTYTKGESDVEILQLAYRAMRKLLDESWSAKAANLPYNNDYQALIMASIVEKETGAATERQQIAGVFIRRLQQGMKLQTDPTVIYGMGDAFVGKISREDLMRPTAYNTYVINGLPPTPIALPSRASLHAALNPDNSKALYFVAKGDGTSVFSETLAEHQRAVVKYQLQRNSDYRSSPK